MNKLPPQKRANPLLNEHGDAALGIKSENNLGAYFNRVGEEIAALDYARRFAVKAMNGKLKGSAPPTAEEFFEEFMERREQGRNREFVEKRAKAKRAQGEKTVKQVLLAYKNSTLPERSRASSIAKQVGVQAGQVRRIIARQKAANQKFSGAEE
jgi:hypothetical protein